MNYAYVRKNYVIFCVFGILHQPWHGIVLVSTVTSQQEVLSSDFRFYWNLS